MALTVIFISCDVSTLVAAPAPTLGSGAIETIVVQTAQAAATQTAAQLPPTLTPTFTPVPTKTPSPTPSPTPTFLFLLATLTRTPSEPTLGSTSGSGDYACRLLSQTPDDNSTFAAGKSFSVSWKVQNTGSVTWDTNSVDFIYINGTKMASIKAADLPVSVDPGKSITLKLTMNAPKQSGNYKTVWTLHQGQNNFCKVNITIVVP